VTDADYFCDIIVSPFGQFEWGFTSARQSTCSSRLPVLRMEAVGSEWFFFKFKISNKPISLYGLTLQLFIAFRGGNESVAECMLNKVTQVCQKTTRNGTWLMCFTCNQINAYRAEVVVSRCPSFWSWESKYENNLGSHSTCFLAAKVLEIGEWKRWG
jgi:hypothetical protein